VPTFVGKKKHKNLLFSLHTYLVCIQYVYQGIVARELHG
jgi:hypothetical protein